MLKSYKILLCTVAIFGSSIVLQGMEKNIVRMGSEKMILSFTKRKKIALNILSKPLNDLSDTELRDIGAKFKEDNDRTCLWFKHHKENLQLALQQTARDAKVKMMGSRRWNTDHTLSDMDAVVVTESDDHEKVIDVLEAVLLKDFFNSYCKHSNTNKVFRN